MPKSNEKLDLATRAAWLYYVAGNTQNEIAEKLQVSRPVAQRLVAQLPDPPPPGSGLARLREARLHVIGAEDAFRALPSGSALDARWTCLRRLRDLGRDTTERWLGEHLDDIGHRPTLDLTGLAPPAVELYPQGHRTSPPTNDRRPRHSRKRLRLR